MTKDTGPRWRLVVTAGVGFDAAAIAVVSLLALWSFMEPNDRILMFNEHVVGGMSDKVLATSLAVFFGARRCRRSAHERRLR